MQEFQGFDNKDFNVTKCLFDDVQNSKLRFMTCREVFLFGLEFTDQPSVANWLAEPETKVVVVLLLLPALQPAPISNSLLTKEERSWVEVAESSTLYRSPGLNDPYGIFIAPLNFFRKSNHPCWGIQSFKIIQTKYGRYSCVISGHKVYS